MEKVTRANHIIELHNEVLHAVRTTRNYINAYLPKLVEKECKNDLAIFPIQDNALIHNLENSIEIGVKRYHMADCIWCHPIIKITDKDLAKLDPNPIDDIITYSKEIWDEENDDIVKARLLVREYTRLESYLRSIFKIISDGSKRKLLPYIIEVNELIEHEAHNIKLGKRRLTNL